MKAFADASFLVSFCAPDAHSEKALSWWNQTSIKMLTSRLALFEAENTIRVLGVGKKLNKIQTQRALETLKRLRLEGFVELWEVPVKRLYPEASRLSNHHNRDKGFGAMDILHVASGKDMKCDALLSFDNDQRELAEAEGLKVLP